MKKNLISEKLPELFDYALAIAISSVPGIAEADAETKALYKLITKELLTHKIKSKGRFAPLRLFDLRQKKKHDRSKLKAC